MGNLLQKVHFPHHSAKGLKTAMQTGATGDFRKGDILLFRDGEDLSFVIFCLFEFWEGVGLRNILFRNIYMNVKSLGIVFRLAKTMESLHIKLSGRYIRGTGPTIDDQRRRAMAGDGPTENPPTETPETSPPPTDNTVPEVAFEDETMYEWSDRISRGKSA